MSYGDETTRGPRGDWAADERTVPLRKVVFNCLAIVSVVTAVIHFAVSGEHFQEYWAFGVFMLVVAWMQLTWAITAIARPSQLLLWAGAFLNTGVVAVYIVTRTVGDVIGPTPHDVEPFGFGDGLCTVLEALTVVGCVWLLVSRSDRPVRLRGLVLASATTGALAAILLSIALVDGGSEMVMGMDASSSTTPVANNAAATHSSGSSGGMKMSGSNKSMNMSMAGISVSSHKLVTTSPAGDITMPNPNMQMAAGMQMASSTPCTARPTKQQQRAAVSLVDRSWKAAQQYRSLAVAKAAGYVPITPVGAPVVHYMNPTYYGATANGGPVLNAAEPQSLVYANTPKGAVLAATMYITSPFNTHTPQPGGCLTQWHVHTNLCLKLITVVGVLNKAHKTCPAGSQNQVTPPMMHVWYVPIPGGPTAVDAPDRQVVQAAERVASPPNGTA
jgi:hypothetical protein